MRTAAATHPQTLERSEEGTRSIRFGLYAEVNMNLIDGSSVWVQSVSQTLTKIPGVEVTLLLRAPEQRDVLTAPLRANERIELIHPEHFDITKPLDAEVALEALAKLDQKRRFDHVLLRGAGICAKAARRRPFPGRMWCYYLTPH